MKNYKELLKNIHLSQLDTPMFELFAIYRWARKHKEDLIAGFENCTSKADFIALLEGYTADCPALESLLKSRHDLDLAYECGCKLRE